MAQERPPDNGGIASASAKNDTLDVLTKPAANDHDVHNFVDSTIRAQLLPRISKAVFSQREASDDIARSYARILDAYIRSA